MSYDFAALQQQLSITFKDRSLLIQALVHSSYVNENPGLTRGHNERLEFLGDAVLGLVIGEKLYRDFPEYAEGELTRLRAALVRRETLSRVAKSINLGDYLYLGKGEEANGGRAKPANLAGAMEAVIAAVYLDCGLTVTAALILRLFAVEIETVIRHSEFVDYKSKLQALIQSKYHLTPVYSTTEVKGPDHERQFTVEVKMDNKTLSKGSGRNKQVAEIEAARLALEQLGDFTP
jgi:ribonuclease-3